MDPITSYFATQGILGVIILMLIAVIIWQQRRIDSKDKLIMDLQDKRILDSNSYSTNYIAIARETVAAAKDSSSAVDLLQRSVDSLTTVVQKLIDKK